MKLRDKTSTEPEVPIIRGTDTSRQSYVEVPTLVGDYIRVTQTPIRQWTKEYHLRIQLRTAQGRIHNGPEFPKSKAPEVLAAITAML